MKKTLISSCLFLSIIQLANGQLPDTAIFRSSQVLHDKYMQNYKTQTTAGWIAFACGLGLTASGSYIYYMQAIGEGGATNTGATLFYLGVITTLASTPLFISAGQYRKKAKLTLKEECLVTGNRLPERSNYLALVLTIPL